MSGIDRAAERLRKKLDVLGNPEIMGLLAELIGAYEEEAEVKQREHEVTKAKLEQVTGENARLHHRDERVSVRTALTRIQDDSDGRKLIELAHKADPMLAERLLTYMGDHVLAGTLRDNRKARYLQADLFE